ncbi:MAG: MoaD/ThiS family protein [Chloroflexota bacterium]|nr:MoaD/ThiS family protein [Chloroflexota bacterium]MDE2935047.1 MoaD/ThiS family protein [Chloroflexota bacterium]
MAVTVKLFPTLQNLSKSKLETLELDWHEGLTAKEILEDEGFNERDQEAVLAVINDEQSQLDTPIADGDAVELRINMQGG